MRISDWSSDVCSSDLLKRLLAAERTGAAAELLGVGGGAMDLTIGYLKERKQFGAPIGSFQALQHRAAHLYSEMEVARSAVLKAQRSEERRVGNEGVRRCRSRGLRSL